MNLILLYPGELSNSTAVVLKDRRFEHIRDVHRAQPGDSLRVGMLDGAIGAARVVRLDRLSVELEVDFSAPRQPPAPLPVILVLALPRPKMFKRIMQTVATLGVKEIWLIHSYRVDKSYWSSPLLSDSMIQAQLLLGLEQAGDTLMPRVEIRKRFKPFVEDELPGLLADRQGWVAHPYDAEPCPPASNAPALVAVGPEGGFISYEVDKLQEAGLHRLSLGSRILRVETAVPVLLSRLFPLS
ncbi:16S rRNA (uracil(1498)-N(3))-methyltransferase [Nitrincola iocasae]|jgi:RsmE family RNA methyltransferase|uniref:Ribosomal RNA small subunit methyltransferase E n=1 Tax=Nitrincola iocasae TaxID=2614693 RepID=A0A5J6LBY6_9GAMM|nr:16S rRNA (uracil(1498)-N(3))-methyltransferase [Nitrincola iocasae]QEW05798.1 16S rRNA (uracil(1498)-N(3))-methyltransferase [Nitrincola iocasae]